MISIDYHPKVLTVARTCEVSAEIPAGLIDRLSHWTKCNRVAPLYSAAPIQRT
jgi:hypothetical protein